MTQKSREGSLRTDVSIHSSPASGAIQQRSLRQITRCRRLQRALSLQSLYLILPFTYTLFTLFYALYGSILYVVGPFVLALIPSRALGQLGRTYFANMMVFQCWGLLYAILQALMTALQITNPMQFNGSFLQAFVGS